MLDVRLAPLRILWVTLPLTLGALLADALDPRADGFRTAVSLACWILWALTLVATLVPRDLTLTIVRIVVPATVPAAIWAALAADDAGTATTVAGLAAATLVTLAALVATTGEAFVDGGSYGDERRMPLKPPGPLLLAPIPLAWALTVVGFTAGPLLLAAERWVAGAIVTALGVPLAGLTARALQRLARRWLVFVPAGFVVHDHLALAEPVLFPRVAITGLSIAPADTLATDFTAGALGVALEARLDQPISLVPAGRADTPAEQIEVTAFLISPSRPGAALREARRRRLPTGV
jgi:hypothetical protein